MKLIRYGEPGKEKPGVIISDKKYDLSKFGKDYDEQFFADNEIKNLEKFINNNRNSLRPLNDNIRLGPPVCRPSKIICVGLNYKDHALETNSSIPIEPIIFFKSQTAICGCNDDLVLPKNSNKVDWEVELAVVISKKATYINEEEAFEYIAGYVLHNDYSERGFQLERGGQWVKGKSCDSFAPLGPFLATPDEVKNINDLKMWLKVNDVIMQDSSTNQMIFSVSFLITYISQFMTLLPGDIISTGTPKGVGLGFNPPIFLKEGDIVELGIECLGSSKQKAIKYANSSTSY